MLRRGSSTTTLLYSNTGLRAKHVEQGSAHPRRRGRKALSTRMIGSRIIIYSLLGLSFLTAFYSIYYSFLLPGEDANVEDFTLPITPLQKDEVDVHILLSPATAHALATSKESQSNTTISRNVSNLATHTSSLNETESKMSNNIESHHLMSTCPRDIQATKLATTLVTQTTLDRLILLKETCLRWTSPIVATVYITPQELSFQKWENISRHYSEQCHHMTLIPHLAKNDQERSEAYPINQLRNEALDEVNTSHAFLIDADFIPSVDLDKGIEKTIRLINGNFNLDRHALVVPAYERTLKSLPCQDLQECVALTEHNPEFMPRSMQSLYQCVHNYANPARNEAKGEDDWLYQSSCIAFHSDHYINGHGDTKSDEWLRNRNQEKVRTIPCTKDGYEPYVVIPWCPNAQVNHGTLHSQNTIKEDVQKDRWAPLSPYYDERFHGYGKNKIQHIRHLQAKGYQFSVIPALGFLTHHPHPMSNTKTHWDDNKMVRKRNRDLYTIFEEELKEQYGEMKTKRCENGETASKKRFRERLQVKRSHARNRNKSVAGENAFRGSRSVETNGGYHLVQKGKRSFI